MSHSFLESANESNFLRHDLTLVLSPAAPGVADVVAASFSSYASDGAWRDFVGATVATVGTDDECGVLCLQRPSDCGFYVHDSSASECHIGSVDRTSSTLSSAADAATVKFYQGAP